ncbi:MAG: hypothetical protein K2K70_09740 [Lachnospiraceae bacterium]|nr:hypothetical protein [Lachnospiraceae bacterium]
MKENNGIGFEVGNSNPYKSTLNGERQKYLERFVRKLVEIGETAMKEELVVVRSM